MSSNKLQLRPNKPCIIYTLKTEMRAHEPALTSRGQHARKPECRIHHGSKPASQTKYLTALYKLIHSIFTTLFRGEPDALTTTMKE